jgi:hypothetical protein
MGPAELSSKPSIRTNRVIITTPLVQITMKKLHRCSPSRKVEEIELTPVAPYANLRPLCALGPKGGLAPAGHGRGDAHANRSPG